MDIENALKELFKAGILQQAIKAWNDDNVPAALLLFALYAKLSNE